jgi:large subunit ribosomal protein L13
MKTFVPESKDIQRDWYLVDANGKTLGRLAVKIANLLRGRIKPIYTPNVDTGDFVVVINAAQVKLTGRKETIKQYKTFTGFRNGLYYTSVASMRATKPERIIEHAVKGMLPHNHIARKMFKRLKVYGGATHPHQNVTLKNL